MTTTTVRTNTLPAADRPPAPRRRERFRLGDKLLHGYTWLVIIWLCIPIAVMILFSFNATRGRFNGAWQGFTFKWYTPSQLGAIPDLKNALFYSLAIAACSTILSTILGGMIGIALGKYRFRGQAVLNVVMFAAISAPEIVLGSSLRSLFVTVNTSFGFVTILIAHVMFSLSFVAIVVRARVLTLDPSIEEAAKDLGASAATTLWRVTLPMIFPALLSGALLAFVLSIDDFVVTSFTAGNQNTFPLWIWGAQKLGLPPQVNVMGTLIFAVGIVLVISNAVVARRRERR